MQKQTKLLGVLAMLHIFNASAVDHIAEEEKKSYSAVLYPDVNTQIIELTKELFDDLIAE